MRSLWRRAVTPVVAFGLLLGSATPLLAYSTLGGDDEWDKGGDNFALILVCAKDNFDASNGNWDMSLERHDAVRDIIQNQLNPIGVNLGYTLFYGECTAIDNPTEIHAHGADGMLSIGWAETSLGENLSSSIAYEKRVETYWGCLSHCLYHASILFDKTDEISGKPTARWYYNDSTAVPTNKYDFREVFSHEMGHASALGHSNVYDALMCSTGGQQPDPTNCSHWQTEFGDGNADRTYHADDIAGLCAEPWDNDPNVAGNPCN